MSLVLDMLAPGFLVVFGHEIERGTLVKPALALPDESWALSFFDNVGIACDAQQHDD